MPLAAAVSPGQTFTLVGVSPLPRPKTGSPGILLYVGQVPKEAHDRDYHFPSPNLTWGPMVSITAGGQPLAQPPSHTPQKHTSPSVG